MSGVSIETLAYIEKGKARSRKTRRMAMVASLVLVFGGVGIALAWRHFHKPLPPVDSDPVALAKFFASAQFANLTEEQKKPYLNDGRSNFGKVRQAADAGKLTADEQQKALDNLRSDFQKKFMEQMHAQVTEYFKLPAGKERDAYLDKKIDENMERRKKRESSTQPSSTQPSGAVTGGPVANANATSGPDGAKPPGAPNGNGTNRFQGESRQQRREDPNWIKQRMETMPADLRAQMQEYRKQYTDRQVARGMTPSNGPGGR